MKNTDLLHTETYSEYFSEESSNQFIVRPYHIITTAILLAAWAWLGTVLIG